MIKFKKIYATGAAALVILLLLNYVIDARRDLSYSSKNLRNSEKFNGVWTNKKSSRTYNDDGSFNVKTLQGFDMKSIPKDTKFADFNDKWKKVSQLPDASDFYGEFANKSGDACITWTDVVNNEGNYYIPDTLHKKYVWQCGGWAGYSIRTDYIPTNKERQDLISYNRLNFLDGITIPAVLICILLIIPSIWCGGWALIGHAYRLAIKAIKN